MFSYDLNEIFFQKCKRAINDHPLIAPAPVSGVPVRLFSTIKSFLQPVQYFRFNPADPVRAELYPLWERPGFFQACYVLR